MRKARFQTLSRFVSTQKNRSWKCDFTGGGLVELPAELEFVVIHLERNVEGLSSGSVAERIRDREFPSVYPEGEEERAS